MEHSNGSGRINSEGSLGIQLENPFALKVGQIFTGFGIGCGVGIGVGRPLNLGAIPALQQVMSATRGATDAFSGVGRHVNSSLRKLGAKNIEAGIGCGIGFGHGFGAGLAIKPGVVYRIQSYLVQAMANMMMRFGIFPGLSVGRSILPGSLQTGMSMINTTSGQNSLGSMMQWASKTSEHSSQESMINTTSGQNPLGSMMQWASKTSEHSSQEPPKDTNLYMGSISEPLTAEGTTLDTSVCSRTEKVISNFLQNPLFNDEDNTELNELAGRMQSENDVLKMLLKHQQVIEELMQENEKLRRILMEDLKVPPDKLQGSHTSKTKQPTICSECFDCRRRQRKLR